MRNRIYFNNAAGAYPLAPGVTEAVARALQTPPQVSGRDASSSSDALRLCRRQLARLFGVDATRTVLTPGATYGINAAISGLDLRRGDLVVATVMEHNSVLRPLAHLEDRQGVRVEYVPLGEGAKLDEEAYDKLLLEKPRLVVLTHACNVTGRVNPVRGFFEKAKAVGAVTLLDACQTVGKIPVKPPQLCADMAVFSGYKGLRGPPGTGVLYVSPDVELDPVFTGGTGVLSESRLQPMDMPMRLEAGTPNLPAFIGLSAALDYYFEHADEIAGKEAMLAGLLLSGLLAIPKTRVFDEDPRDRLPVISFEVEGMDYDTVGYALSHSYNIECREGLHCAPLMHRALNSPGTVRFSLSYANSAEEIEYALEAVRKIAA